jgi:hypothetical protein
VDALAKHAGFEAKVSQVMRIDGRMLVMVVELGGTLLLSTNLHAGGLAFDAAGDLYVSQGDSVFKFTPDAKKSAFASGLKNATGLAFDHRGNLFLSDAGNNSISKLAPDGTKTPFVAGTSSRGMAFDRTDNLYLTQGRSILKFTPEGTQSTFASGLGDARDLVFDQAGNLFVLDAAAVTGPTIFKFTPDGAKSRSSFVITIRFDHPSGLAVDAAGNVYLADAKSDAASHGILKFTPDGTRSMFAETPDAGPLGSIAIDGSGNAFVFNSAAMTGRSILKFSSRGARSVSTSPDKQWEYRLAENQFPEIARVGATPAAIDLSKEQSAPYPTEDAVVWAPDSMRFAFNFSPPHAPHTSYETTVIYELRGDEWKPATPLVDESSDLCQLAQLGKGRLTKRIAREHAGERDILKLRRWIDADTAIVYSYSAGAGARSRQPAPAYVFTVKFDAAGKWKITEMHPASPNE